jgi:hypothetical protein
LRQKHIELVELCLRRVVVQKSGGALHVADDGKERSSHWAAKHQSASPANPIRSKWLAIEYSPKPLGEQPDSLFSYKHFSRVIPPAASGALS